MINIFILDFWEDLKNIAKFESVKFTMLYNRLPTGSTHVPQHSFSSGSIYVPLTHI